MLYHKHRALPSVGIKYENKIYLLLKHKGREIFGILYTKKKISNVKNIFETARMVEKFEKKTHVLKT